MPTPLTCSSFSFFTMESFVKEHFPNFYLSWERQLHCLLNVMTDVKARDMDGLETLFDIFEQYLFEYAISIGHKEITPDMEHAMAEFYSIYGLETDDSQIAA